MSGGGGWVGGSRWSSKKRWGKKLSLLFKKAHLHSRLSSLAAVVTVQYSERVGPNRCEGLELERNGVVVLV